MEKGEIERFLYNVIFLIYKFRLSQSVSVLYIITFEYILSFYPIHNYFPTYA